MFIRLLTSGLMALALGCSFAAAAQDANEPAAAAEFAAEEAIVPTESPAEQSAAAVVHAAAAVADTYHGLVSFYGREFAGRRTASGERFDPSVLTMAHKTLAFGTLVRVTNLRNDRSVVVRVNDRGPFVASRVADLSAGAARLLGMLGAGLAQARLEVLGPAGARAARGAPRTGR